MSIPSIDQKITSYILTNQDSDEQFNQFALELYQKQLIQNAPYREFVNLITGNQPIHSWKDIPAIPTDAFKSKDYPPSCLAKEQQVKTFFTSGTTTEVKGCHHFHTTEIYNHSILQAWNQLQLPELGRLLILTPSPRHAPHSSLSHMMEVLRKKHGEGSYLIGPDHIIDIPILLDACKSNEPVTLLGTALGFLHVFELLDTPLPLPAGSWAMETGGYKGTHHNLTKPDLYQQFSYNLGLDLSSIWNEYSMTELSSQFYTRGLESPHQGPHWTRIRIINPETGDECNLGTPGYLVIYDLANVNSCMAIQTQDIAIAHGDNSFTLVGRDPSALPRGCSRSIDEQLTKSI